VEWFFVLVVAMILVGPIVWVVIRGRRSGAPDQEDAKGSTAYGESIRDAEGTPGSPPY
jgi:hypothetical protein